MALSPPLSPADIARLKDHLRRPTSTRTSARDAKILMRLGDGLDTKTVASGQVVSRNVVQKVRRRYQASGVEGVLAPKLNAGGRPRLSASKREQVVELGRQTAPRLTCKQIAEATGVSVGSVSGLLKPRAHPVRSSEPDGGV